MDVKKKGKLLLITAELWSNLSVYLDEVLSDQGVSL